MKYDIDVDGSIGGGSVLRVAVPLALGKKKSIRIYNIRATRRKPGLRTQHLIVLQTLAEITGSEFIGGFIGSTEIGFIPKNRERQNHIDINIPTAASVSLIVQALCNFTLISGQDVSINFYGGGTHTNWSPSFDYLQNVTRLILRKFSLDIDIEIKQIGFYPKGDARGSVSVSKIAKHITNMVEMEESAIIGVKMIVSASAKLSEAKVIERQVQRFTKKFSMKYHYPLDYQKIYDDTASPGTAATIIINYKSSIPKGVTVLGERGVSSEKIADNLFAKFEEVLQKTSALDEFMSDQIVVPLSIAPTGSFVTITGITDHVKANITLVNNIFGHSIEIQEKAGITRLIKV